MTFTEALPSINAGLNGLATILLTLGFIFIRSGREQQHRTCMVSAFIVSAIFLFFYLLHKYLVQGVHTPFAGEGFWKSFYYAMLISHIILAMIIVPLILMTLSLAIRGKRETHKKWARWTFPIWYYVSVTGVLVYFFLYQWF
jgi:putative membrane protein